MIQSVATSGIRTASAYLVAWLLSLKFAGPVLTLFNVGSATARERLTSLAIFVIGTIYYLVVRILEEHFPKVGVLLGVPSKPTYSASAVGSTSIGSVSVRVIPDAEAFKADLAKILGDARDDVLALARTLIPAPALAVEPAAAAVVAPDVPSAPSADEAFAAVASPAADAAVADPAAPAVVDPTAVPTQPSGA